MKPNVLRKSLTGEVITDLVGGGGEMTFCSSDSQKIQNLHFLSLRNITTMYFYSVSGFEFVRSTDQRGIRAPGAAVTWKVSCCLLVFVQGKCIKTAAA